MVRILLILFIFSFCACKHGGSDSNSNVITDPALLPPGAIAIIDGIPICEIGDHSCMDGTFGVPLTKKQCESLQGWQLGDPDVYYIATRLSGGGRLPTFMYLSSEGAIRIQYIPETDSYLEHEHIGRSSLGFQIEKECRCQVNFEDGLLTGVIVESKWTYPTPEQAEVCATKEK